MKIIIIIMLLISFSAYGQEVKVINTIVPQNDAFIKVVKLINVGVAVGDTTVDRDSNGAIDYADTSAYSITSGLMYNDISDPDANGSINFGSYTGLYTSSADAWGGLSISNTVADVTSDGILLSLKYTDDSDPNGMYIVCFDNAIDTTFIIGYHGQIDIKSKFTGEGHSIHINPQNAIAANNVDYDAISVEGDNLDPSGDGVEICGLEVEFDGIDVTNNPDIRAVNLQVPSLNYNAIYTNGRYTMLADATFFADGMHGDIFDITIDREGSTGGTGHVLQATFIGDGGAHGAIIGAYGPIDIIHQHSGDFSVPDQTVSAYACRDTAGTIWAGIDDQYIFVNDNDNIYLGANEEFDAISCELTQFASQDCWLKFYYYDGGWTRFFPSDGTDGMRNDGLITWSIEEFTSWDNDADPAGDTSATGYWIRIIRERNNIVTLPVAETFMLLTSAEYIWDSLGVITAKSVYKASGVADSQFVTFKTIDKHRNRYVPFNVVHSKGDMGGYDASTLDTYLYRDSSTTLNFIDTVYLSVVLPWGCTSADSLVLTYRTSDASTAASAITNLRLSVDGVSKWTYATPEASVTNERLQLEVNTNTADFDMGTMASLQIIFGGDSDEWLKVVNAYLVVSE